jgi:Conjugative transposon protein TcpC
METRPAEGKPRGGTWKDIVLYKILNQKPPGYEDMKAKTGAPAPAALPPEPVRSSLGDTLAAYDARRQGSAENPWVPAGGVVERPSEPAAEELPDKRPASVPWTTLEDSGSNRAWRRTGRTVLIVALLFFAWVGFRTAFFSSGDDGAAELPAAITFDTAQAQGVATRFAATALTWNEDAPDSHSEAVGLDYVDGESDLGWNGKGRQYANRVIAGPVQVADDGQSAVVTVYVDAYEYEREEGETEWTLAASQWLTVEVPVSWTADGRRLVATAAPALTGQAAPSAVPGDGPAALTDGELTAATKQTAEAFFEAYGAGDVSAVEAPGANIAAPVSGWKFKALTSWSVDQVDGNADRRVAHATVTWSSADQVEELTQTYRLSLALVSSGGQDRWQVEAITAGEAR